MNLMPLDHIAHLRTAAEGLAAALDRGPIDTPVPSCPGWDLRRLAGHVGFMHRWAAQAVLTGETPSARPLDPVEGTDLGEWLRRGATELADTLEGADLEAPTWHPFPAPKVVGTWARRQAHETLIHRWDAEHALGIAQPIDAETASDGIDEYFTVMLPRMVQRDGLTVPGYSLHVHCTDVPGEWLVAAEGVSVGVERVHAKGDAALRGAAQDLLLALWGRPAPDPPEIVGDPIAADAWLALGGS